MGTKLGRILVIIPMYLMVCLIVMVLIYGVIIRIRAVKTKQVHGAYFREFEARDKIPSHIVKNTNNMSNLFELPILFFVVCTLFVLRGYDEFDAMLAYAFVFSRYVHSFIHMTYNNVIHRLCAFATGVAILLVMWTSLLLEVL